MQVSIRLTPELHPGVPVTVHPGVDRPHHAAAREALGVLYSAYAALEDAEHHRASPVAEVDLERALQVVEQCLEELREMPGAEGAIERVERARNRLTRRWQGGGR
jgi:hypothetical protein